MMRFAGIFVLVVATGACRTSSVRRASDTAPETAIVHAIFGPVIGQEVIAGRADEGDEILLLAGGADLVRIRIAARQARRVRLQTAPGASCWGLARLASGSLWTLETRGQVARIGDDGRVLQRMALPAPHFGLFGIGNRLVFQEANFTPPGPALRTASSDGDLRVPWSAIVTRTFPSLARASVAALNMVTCGASASPERACWFPDEPAVSLVRDDGATRRVGLAGLEAVTPETLLTSDNPRRPVRDAFVDRDGDVWVLSSGAPPPGAAEVPGGWILARYGPAGEVHGAARLSEAVRMILDVDGGRVVVLLSTGKVGEVDRW